MLDEKKYELLLPVNSTPRKFAFDFKSKESKTGKIDKEIKEILYYLVQNNQSEDLEAYLNERSLNYDNFKDYKNSELEFKARFFDESLNLQETATGLNYIETL